MKRICSDLKKQVTRLQKEEMCTDFAFLFDEIEPSKELSLKDIKNFIESHKGELSSEDLRRRVLINIPLAITIKEWLDTIKNPDTRKKYKLALDRIFGIYPLCDMIENNCAITTLDKNGSGSGVFNLIKEINAPSSSIKLCESVYSRFCDFIRIITLGIVNPEESPQKKEEYLATSIVNKKINWEEFIDCLEAPYNLLAEMAFLAAKKCEFRLRLVNSIKNVLSLDISQINFKNRTISFNADQGHHVVDILGAPLCISFPKKFMDKMKDYVKGREGVVFISKKNKPIFSIQVQRAFKKASRDLPYKITPVMLGWAGVLAYKEKKTQQ